mmetsp:Transcript_25162/g.58214  ORF Transcript_25162/g.58214 Transcript_25162/m.58214 type:complete len:246 (+) Transcript_25162:102-839(+)
MMNARRVPCVSARTLCRFSLGKSTPSPGCSSSPSGAKPPTAPSPLAARQRSSSPPPNSACGERSTDMVSSEPASRCSGSATEPPVVYTCSSAERTLAARPLSSRQRAASSVRTRLSTRSSSAGSARCSRLPRCRCTSRCSRDAWQQSSAADAASAPGVASKRSRAASASAVSTFFAPHASSAIIASPSLRIAATSACESNPRRSASSAWSASARESGGRGSHSASRACQSSTDVPAGGTTKTPCA